MNDAAIQAFQRDATIGHRPTWQMGVNAKTDEPVRTARPSGFAWSGRTQDPFRFFGDGFQARGPDPERRKVHEYGGPVAARRSGSKRARPPRKSRRATSSWSNATIPTPMAATARWRTGCERSFRLTAI